MIRKSGLMFILLGVLSILFFLMIDALRIGNNQETIGAAQILGIEFGITLIVVGFGFLKINFSENKITKKHVIAALHKIVDLPSIFWVVTTFLALYLLFFISPMFFSTIKVQYFFKYIPDAWAPYLGFDIETTVRHINEWLTKGVSPYSDGIVPYTPLTLALFTPFIILGYPDYLKLLTMITLASYILATFIIPLFFLQNRKPGFLLLLGVIGLFSYGFQFEIERGQFNMIAFALCLLAVYIFNYQHNFRYFAYLLFSIAVQLKLYPAIFVVMLVRDWRDWKNNIRRVLGLAVFNFLLLFVMGYQLFLDFMRQITSRQLSLQSSRFEDLSISGFTYFLSEGDYGILSRYAGVIGILILALLGVILLAIILHLNRNRETGFNPYLLMVCTIGALMIPTASFDYKLPILTAPMIIFLSCMPAIRDTYEKAASIAIIILMSAAYWSTLYPFTVKSPVFYRNSPALLTILFTTAILYFLLKGKFENTATNKIEKSI